MRILFTLCLFTFISCTKSIDDLPTGLQYFPDLDLLEEGLVFKFYNHRGKIGAPTKTDIVYRKMRIKGNDITSISYDAAFQKTYHFEIEIEGSKWKTISEKSFTYRNTHTELFKEYIYTFGDNIMRDWEQNEAKLEKTVMFGDYGSRIENKQMAIIDSIGGGKKIKIFKGQRKFTSIVDGEEKEPIYFNSIRYYEEGLGLKSSTLINEEYKYDLVLDEIMTLKEFERRANHGTHRVAYIDTLKTIDDHTLFQPCFLPDKINDYYNDKRSGYKGGKGRLRALLKEKMDPSRIVGESGYLTFRFVVNCNGEAGWFVTEEAALDYQKKQFSEGCRMHLYEILKAEKEWTSLIIGEEARDAYTYITFKIKNGEIIELLP